MSTSNSDMELPSSSLAGLNALLPPGFLVETQDPADSHRRRNELDRLQLASQFTESPLFLAPAQQEDTGCREVPKVPAGEGFKRLSLILSKLKKHPDCSSVLTCSELSSVETRLLNGEYVEPRDFVEDLRRVLAQSPSPSLHKLFESLITGHEDLSSSPRKKPKLVPTVLPLSIEEKRNLAGKIRLLEAKYLKGIEEVTQVKLEGKDLMIYLSRLQASTARGLNEYVELCLEKAKRQQKSLPPETQTLPQEPTLSLQEQSPAFMPPIKAPVRLGITGFHELLSKVTR